MLVSGAPVSGELAMDQEHDVTMAKRRKERMDAQADVIQKALHPTKLFAVQLQRFVEEYSQWGPRCLQLDDEWNAYMSVGQRIVDRFGVLEGYRLLYDRPLMPEPASLLSDPTVLQHLPTSIREGLDPLQKEMIRRCQTLFRISRPKGEKTNTSASPHEILEARDCSASGRQRIAQSADQTSVCAKPTQPPSNAWLSTQPKQAVRAIRLPHGQENGGGTGSELAGKSPGVTHQEEVVPPVSPALKNEQVLAELAALRERDVLRANEIEQLRRRDAEREAEVSELRQWKESLVAEMAELRAAMASMRTPADPSVGPLGGVHSLEDVFSFRGRLAGNEA